LTLTALPVRPDHSTHRAASMRKGASLRGLSRGPTLKPSRNKLT
jgi:hypothetical protein